MVISNFSVLFFNSL